MDENILRMVYLTYENRPVSFFTYHGFLTITTSSRIISNNPCRGSDSGERLRVHARRRLLRVLPWAVAALVATG
jgi:hypothetical protein